MLQFYDTLQKLMNISAFKNRFYSNFKAGSAILVRSLHIRPKPDGLDFFTRKICLNEARNLTFPDKIASFIQARRAALTPLAKMVMNNLIMVKIDSDEREKFSSIAKCQYKKFLKLLEEVGMDEDEFKTEFEQWGNVVDHVKKELWTPMTLNTTGQITNYELMLNGVAIGYIQFMEKTFVRKSLDSKYVGKLEVEAAFGVELPADSAQITDISIDSTKTLWALNLALLSADKIGSVEDEIENGLLVYVASVLFSIIENPRAMFTSDISNVSFVSHYNWMKKMVELGLIEKGNIIDIPNIGKYYGLPIEVIKLINFSREQIRETSVKINYLRNNKLKESAA